MTGDVLFSAGDTAFVVQAMTGFERLGEASDFELDLLSPEVVDGAHLVGAAGTLELIGAFGTRAVHGIITRFSAVATSQSAPSRRYKARLCSAFFRLTMRRSMRVFQNMTAADVIKKLLGEGGVPPDRVAIHLVEIHAPRRYVVQYNEADATFIRRLCEEEGLYFRFEARDGVDVFVLEDSSTSAPPAADTKLTLADALTTLFGPVVEPERRTDPAVWRAATVAIDTAKSVRLRRGALWSEKVVHAECASLELSSEAVAARLDELHARSGRRMAIELEAFWPDLRAALAAM